MARTYPFPKWAPDLSELGTGVSAMISGAVPRSDGYGPFKSLVDFTQALPGTCRGYFFARRNDGSIAVFAGTATNLYLLDNTTLAWNLVSKGGVAYSSVTGSDQWRFAQFNDLVIAVQINTVPQKFALSSSVEFADLGGSPPQASHVAIIGRFVVLTGLLISSRRVQWSDLDGPETWTAGTGLSDYQDLPDGGKVSSAVGGDQYGVIFQEEGNRNVTYSPGSATTFSISRITKSDTIFAQYGAVEANGSIFFISAQGFKRIDPGNITKQIGKDQVDTTFFRDVDVSALQLIVAVADPKATRVYWPYKSQAGQTGLFDKLMCYDWHLEQWAVLPFFGEFLGALARPGLTLEQLDAIAPTPLQVTGAANNGSGRIRLTLSALSNADFSIVGQNFIVVQGVTGTTEANGTWSFTVIDATHIDLDINQNTGAASAFVNAYVAGGAIGGSLDALPCSLDSVSNAAVNALSAVSSAHKAGFFDGPNIEAILETSEQDAEGDLVFITGVTPITDAADMVCSIGKRLTAQAAVTYSTERPINSRSGMCGASVETRYARVRGRIPAGAVWTYARGVQPEVQPAGED